MPQFDPSHFYLNYSGRNKRKPNSHHPTVYLSRQTLNYQEPKKTQSMIPYMKKATLRGPVIKTEEEGMMKWRGKKYSNDLSTSIEERKKEMKEKDLS